MAPKLKPVPWTDTQIAFVLERNAAGASNAELEGEVKGKWPERELARGAVANLIYRQKRKSKLQDSSPASREPSVAASSRSENPAAPRPKASAPSMPETPVVKKFTPAEMLVTPDTSPAIPPGFATPPPTAATSSPGEILLSPRKKDLEPKAKEQESLETHAPTAPQPPVLFCQEDSMIPGLNDYPGQPDSGGSPLSSTTLNSQSLPSLPSTMPTSSVQTTSIGVLGEANVEDDGDEEVASFEAELDFSSDNIRTELPEPELPVSTRPAKRVKASQQTEEIETEAEAEAEAKAEQLIHQMVDHKVNQAPESPSPQVSTPKSISENRFLTRQTVPALPFKMSAPQANRTRPEPSSLFESLGSEIVHFIVGPKRKDCAVHTNLLTQSSAFFRNITFDNTEPGRAEYSLPNADSDAVAYILNWLYRQKPDLFLGVATDGTLSERGSDSQVKLTAAVTRAIGVYLLAEELGMVELADIVMTALGVAYCQGKIYPSSSNIVLVYSRADSKSPLRKYMARSYQMVASLEGESEGESEGEGDGDAEIASTGWTANEVNNVVHAAPDLFKDYRRLSRKSIAVGPIEPALDPICAYHAHGPDAYCEYKDLTFAGMLKRRSWIWT
ncbi:hypothetical protein PZA11_003550 [Diplocarpon coronariae]|nr:hypothetical protein JHW43_005458 [Diplocarpon mali]